MLPCLSYNKDASPMIQELINNVKRGTFANCVVLHDFDTPNPERVKQWFEYTVKFFEENGVVPNRSSGTKRSKQNISFERAVKQYENQGFQDLEDIWFGALPPTNYNSDIEDIIFGTYLNSNLNKKNKTLVLVFDNQIVSFERTIIDKLATDLSQFFNPKYGYAYQREFKKGPTWYPFGVIGGNDDIGREEERKIGEWGRRYHANNNRYKTGDLRDIYPMNLLSTAHQNNTVNEVPFFDWIRENPKHGTLTELTKNLWAWWVEPEEIPAVREELRPTGWVIAI